MRSLYEIVTELENHPDFITGTFFCKDDIDMQAEYLEVNLSEEQMAMALKDAKATMGSSLEEGYHIESVNDELQEVIKRHVEVADWAVN